MSVDQFLQAVEDKGYLDPKKLARLRKKIALEDPSAKKVARTLIKGGYITKYQAQRIFTELSERDASGYASGSTDSNDDLLTADAPREDVLVPIDETDEPLEPLEAGPVEISTLSDDGMAPSGAPGDDPFTAAVAEASAGAPLDRGNDPSLWKWLWPGRSAYRKRGNQWDSPLMLLGGGGLVLLVMIGAALYFFLSRETGDELFQAAQDDYASQSYSHAVSKYDKYLEKFPKHTSVSMARVRRGLALMRKNVERGNNWQRSLSSAKEILPQIKGEPAFKDVRAELSGILPEIYEGFVTEAEATNSIEEKEQLLAMAEVARALVNDSEYMPTSQRKSQQGKIDAVGEMVALIRREIKRERQLGQAISAIDVAIEQGDTRSAFQARSELLGEYPGLRSDSRLRDVVLRIMGKQVELVQTGSDEIPSVGEDHVIAGVQKVILSDTRGEPASGVEGQVVTALVEGALYVLDASTGQVLWRRWLGYESRLHPRIVDGDVLVMDARHQELLKLDGQTGKLGWLLPVDDVTAAPIDDGLRVYLSETSGRVLVIEAGTGASRQQVKLPQSLTTSATLDVSDGVIYQLADHSSLYVLERETLACQQVLYVGHQPGTVTVPPVLAGGIMFIAQNDGVDYALWKAYALDREKGVLQPLGEPVRLDGHVVVPPLVFGERLLVATDRGAVYVFEVDTASADQAVRLVAEKVGTAKQPLTGFPLVDGQSVYLGQSSLLRLDVQAARGKLVRKWIVDDGDVQLAPLQKHGEFLYQVRRHRRSGATLVAATPLAADARDEHIWETEIATSPAIEPFMNRRTRRVVVLSSNGKAWEIGTSEFRDGHSGTAVELAGARRSTTWSQPVRLASGTRVLSPTEPDNRVLVYDPTDGGKGLVTLSLDVGQQGTSWTMGAVGDELLIAFNAGSVYMLDRERGRQSLLPFQPPVVSGQTTSWLRPTAIDDERRRFAIAHSAGKMYLVSQQSDPDHLAAVAEIDIPLGWTGNMAVAGDSVYVVDNSGATQKLVSFSASDLTEQQTFEMDGNAVWGPEVVGRVVLLATDRNRLYCLGAGNQLEWEVELGHGPLVGRPLVTGNEFVMASATGRVWRLHQENGEVIKWREDALVLDLGESLGSGPSLLGKLLLLLSADGTLLAVPTPDDLGR